MGYPTYPEHPTRTVQRIYVASSWRNPYQPEVVSALRGAGFEVYDFRHPRPDNEGFQWSEIDPDWQTWTPERDDQLRDLLRSGKRMHEIVAALGVGSNAVRHRMSDLGLSIRTGWRSDFEVQRALGVSWRFTRRWREQGLLVYRAHNSTTWHRISDADLEAFVREHAGTLVEVARIKDPELRRIAEVAAVVNQRRVVS